MQDSCSPRPRRLDTSSLPQAKAARLPRHQGLWAAVTLEELTDRRRDGTFSARTRLLLYLRIKSRRGQKPVVLTNTMTEEIGLDRQAETYLPELPGSLRRRSRGAARKEKPSGLRPPLPTRGAAGVILTTDCTNSNDSLSLELPHAGAFPTTHPPFVILFFSLLRLLYALAFLVL